MTLFKREGELFLAKKIIIRSNVLGKKEKNDRFLLEREHKNVSM